jgi:BirA family biotin operon repressor/biotin-[acetyl-CoA-carboxylase] ligase
MHGDLRRPPLDGSLLREILSAPELPWRRLDIVTETGSTNADLLARAAAGENIDGAVLIAENQTAGRGRNGRQWSAAPRAQIIMSVGVGAGGVPTEAWGRLPLAVGVGVVDAVAAVTGIRARLKWPNDVIADGGKLAGILAEVASPKQVIVVGVGVNVTLRPDEADTVNTVVTSLAELGVVAPDRQQLARRLLRELGVRISNWRSGGGLDANLMAAYRTRSLTIGTRVRALLPGGGEIVGVARSVDEQGRLCIESDGRSVAVAAADVLHLGPSRRRVDGSVG